MRVGSVLRSLVVAGVVTLTAIVLSGWPRAVQLSAGSPAFAAVPDTHPLRSPDAIFHAGGWLDAAPSGVPDFDQKQAPWFDDDVNWSWDGPLAAANALWYLDSLFEPFPAALPAVSDYYSLVESYQPSVLDDHDSDNLISLAYDLAARMDTDGQATGFPHTGTDPVDMESALDLYVQDKGVSMVFDVSLMSSPTFADVTSAVTDGTLVLLLLGFWQEQPAEVRMGGHWVTVAGVDVASNQVYFADPFVDNAEAGGAGVVAGHAGGSHSAETHNDPAKVSYDRYGQSGRSGTGGVWGTDHYLSLNEVANFSADMNNTHALAPFFDLADAGQALIVKAEYAVFIDPDYACVGDWDDDLDVDVNDLGPLVATWREGQPACLDDNGDGVITIDELMARIKRLGQEYLVSMP